MSEESNTWGKGDIYTLKRICILLFPFIALFFLFVSSNVYSEDCFQNYANKYCSSQNLTSDLNVSYSGGWIGGYNHVRMSCYNQTSESYRITDDTHNYTKFYFLPSEIESCKTKERWRF